MTREMIERVESLRRAVAYGRQQGKTNMIADLDLLQELFLAMDWLQARKDDLEATLGRGRWSGPPRQ